MEKLEHDLLTSYYTEVWHEDSSEIKFNVPNHFQVRPTGDSLKVLTEVNFQEGPCKECGVNGVGNEDLIAMVICRLESFQKSEYSCRENAVAITKLEEALLWLRKRTMGREKRKVLGTSIK
jgi:hypothetical protein